jgi:hypothetical protein
VTLASLAELLAAWRADAALPQVAGRLVSMLERAGEHASAHALAEWLAGGSPSQMEHRMVDVSMLKSRCVASRKPPTPSTGTIWFDPYDVSFYVAVGDKWLATRPVKNFQFCAFLMSADMSSPVFDAPRDFLKLNRFMDQPPLESATNLYHEEAQRYSLWVKKNMVRHSTLLELWRRDDSEVQQQLLPQGMWTWAGDRSEVLPAFNFAFSAATLGHDQSLPHTIREAEQLSFVRRTWTKAIDCGLIVECPV